MNNWYVLFGLDCYGLNSEFWDMFWEDVLGKCLLYDPKLKISQLTGNTDSEIVIQEHSRG